MTMQVSYRTQIVNTVYLDWQEPQTLGYVPQNGDAKETGTIQVTEMLIISRAEFGATAWHHEIHLVGRKVRKNGEPYAVGCEITIPAEAASGRMHVLFQQYKPEEPPTATPARTVTPTVGA